MGADTFNKNPSVRNSHCANQNNIATIFLPIPFFLIVDVDCIRFSKNSADQSTCWFRRLVMLLSECSCDLSRDNGWSFGWSVWLCIGSWTRRRKVDLESWIGCRRSRRRTTLSRRSIAGRRRSPVNWHRRTYVRSLMISICEAQNGEGKTEE